MILSVRINNFTAYEHSAEFSLIADKKIRKFGSNVLEAGEINVLKSACIFGANNAGKTCVLNAISAIKSALNNDYSLVVPNAFASSKECSLGISFLYDGSAYSYDFTFDCSGAKRKILKEKFCIFGSNEVLFSRDDNGIWLDGNIVKGDYDDDKLLIYALPEALIGTYRKISVGFSQRVDILTLDNIPIEKTLEVLKHDSVLRQKTLNLIRLADLDVDDYQYLSGKTESTAPAELALKQQDEIGKLSSLKGNKPLSFIYDSTGTKKLIALSSYIVEALMFGRVLVVDELDSSLHFKLTRAIVALFNNELSFAQLIFSAHDINLMDCKKLLRCDQVWFAAKKDGGASLYPLLSLMDGRTETDVIDGYKAGLYGAMPDPDFITLLLKEIKEDEDD